MAADGEQVPEAVRPADLSRVIEACRDVGTPCAVAGLTLAVLRGWLDVPMPPAPQLVVPATRRLVPKCRASLRRVTLWEQLEIIGGPWGLPWLGVLDGMVTLAPDCDDGQFHTLVQKLAYEGRLSIGELMRRRRTGLPGSALITRVGSRYLLGMDSPREVEVFNVLTYHHLAPHHLNVSVRIPTGETVGPFDGYHEAGAAYEVDGVEVHTDAAQLVVDANKVARAEAIGLHVVRFIGTDITLRRPMLEGWTSARTAALESSPSGLEVIHLPHRSCPCGHRAELPVD